MLKSNLKHLRIFFQFREESGKIFSKKLWKRSFFFFLLLMTLLATAAGTYVWLSCHRRKTAQPPPVSDIRKHVKNGDIILRSGIGMWSNLFRNKNAVDKRFSHVGIVWINSGGKFQVIHSEGNDISGNGEVQIISLEDFVRESDSIGISRWRHGDAAFIAENARAFLSKPFDWKFDSTDHSAIYCTELIELSLQKSFPAIRLPRIDNIIMPEACLDSQYFEEIKSNGQR